MWQRRNAKDASAAMVSKFGRPRGKVRTSRGIRIEKGVMPLYDCLCVCLSLPVFLVNAERRQRDSRAPPAIPAGDTPSTLPVHPMVYTIVKVLASQTDMSKTMLKQNYMKDIEVLQWGGDKFEFKSNYLIVKENSLTLP